MRKRFSESEIINLLYYGRSRSRSVEAWEQRRPAAVLESATRVIVGGASGRPAWAVLRSSVARIWRRRMGVYARSCRILSWIKAS